MNMGQYCLHYVIFSEIVFTEERDRGGGGEPESCGGRKSTGGGTRKFGRRDTPGEPRAGRDGKILQHCTILTIEKAPSAVELSLRKRARTRSARCGNREVQRICFQRTSVAVYICRKCMCHI